MVWVVKDAQANAVWTTDTGPWVNAWDLVLSPDGAKLAFGHGSPALYVNGRWIDNLSAPGEARNGDVLVWLDADRLLVNWTGGARVYHVTDGWLDHPPLPNLIPANTWHWRNAVPITSDLFYALSTNSIYSVTTGTALWSGGGDALIGGVSEQVVVYAKDGHIVRLAPHGLTITSP